MEVTAELRWFWRGGCPDVVSRWFHAGPFIPPGADKAVRVDRYLLNTGSREIGLKLRSEGEREQAVELKDQIGFGPVIAVGPGCRRRAQLWCKWRLASIVPGPTIPVEKARLLRRFAVGRHEVREVPSLAAEQSRSSGEPELACEVELSSVLLPGADGVWATLAFEAGGDPASAGDALGRVAEATQPPLPAGGSLWSYPEWLEQAPRSR